MDQKEVRTTLDAVKGSAQNALSGVQAKIKEMDREKAMNALTGAKEGAKGAWSEIKANFKADEGTSGVRRIQSMFANLWKSGRIGKAALMACLTSVLLMLAWVFGGGGVDEIYEKTMWERYEVAGEICELDALLGHEDLMSALWEGVGLSLEAEHEVEERLKEYDDASSDKRKGLLMVEMSMLKEFKNVLRKKKDECAKKGVGMGDGNSSPLRVAKKFLSLFLARKFGDAYDDCCVDDEKFERILGVFGEITSKDIDDIYLMGADECQKSEMRAGLRETKKRLEAVLEKKCVIRRIEINAKRQEAEVALRVNGRDERDDRRLYLKKVDDGWKVYPNYDRERDNFFSLFFES